MVIPLLPVTFFLSPSLWRAACPLATLDLLGGPARGLDTRAAPRGPAPTRSASSCCSGSSLRRVLLEFDGGAMTGILLAFGALAYLVGRTRGPRRPASATRSARCSRWNGSTGTRRCSTSATPAAAPASAAPPWAAWTGRPGRRWWRWAVVAGHGPLAPLGARAIRGGISGIDRGVRPAARSGAGIAGASVRPGPGRGGPVVAGRAPGARACGPAWCRPSGSCRCSARGSSTGSRGRTWRRPWGAHGAGLALRAGFLLVVGWWATQGWRRVSAPSPGRPVRPDAPRRAGTRSTPGGT